MLYLFPFAFSFLFNVFDRSSHKLLEIASNFSSFNSFRVLPVYIVNSFSPDRCYTGQNFSLSRIIVEQVVLKR